MGRLNRSQMQERNRAKVLAAARAEFTERGFRDAKIDVIAARAELTRGAVYSNFPGKRALYLAVLAEDAERAEPLPDLEPGRTVPAALAAFAGAWLAGLPLAVDDPRGRAPLGADLLPEVLADDRMRPPFTQLTKLQAVLLGLALERLRPAPGRLVRVAEAALTTLHGAGVLSAAAPGFVEPFDVVAGCRRLAELDLDDRWDPPYAPYVPRARPADDSWVPPPAVDALRAAPAALTDDGVVAVLGLHRLGTVEDAVRGLPRDAVVTAVLVSGEPAELLPLARLVVADLRRCLRSAIPAGAWPRLQVVLDGAGTVAAAAGVPAVGDATEVALRVRGGRIVTRADGFGACLSATAS
jgi:AcrR family transcriptional regulator